MHMYDFYTESMNKILTVTFLKVIPEGLPLLPVGSVDSSANQIICPMYICSLVFSLVISLLIVEQSLLVDTN